MRVFANSPIWVLLALLWGACAQADGPASRLPDRDEILAQYHTAAPHWPTLPRLVLLALVAAEDPGFFDRPPHRSPITGQLGRMSLGRPAKGLHRLAATLAIARELSHDEILHWYGNTVFAGQNCYGLPDAAMAYFGTSVDGLSLAQSAYLAAVPWGPSNMHPLRSSQRALARRNQVLSRMAQAGVIPDQVATKAARSDLGIRVPLQICDPGAQALTGR